LPAAGKTTLAGLLAAELRSCDRDVTVLDGDIIRREVSPALGFSRDERNENVGRIAEMARTLVDQGTVVIVACISPYAEARTAARHAIGRFVEVHVDCPLSVCESRDPKGLYARARSGKISSFTGVDDVYEPPSSPELRVHTHLQTPAQSIAQIGATLAALGYSLQGRS
jgi:adenylyl-sulfate kinase